MTIYLPLRMRGLYGAMLSGGLYHTSLVQQQYFLRL